MRGHLVLAILLVAGIYPQALAKEDSVNWAVNATINDGCSCRMLCPCIFESPAEVGTVGTHKHEGKTSCYFNAAFKVNKGNYGKAKLDGLKFWFAGDKGDAKTVELTFEPSATKEQREGVRVFLAHSCRKSGPHLLRDPTQRSIGKSKRRTPRPSSMGERPLKW